MYSQRKKKKKKIKKKRMKRKEKKRKKIKIEKEIESANEVEMRGDKGAFSCKRSVNGFVFTTLGCEDEILGRSVAGATESFEDKGIDNGVGVDDEML